MWLFLKPDVCSSGFQEVFIKVTLDLKLSRQMFKTIFDPESMVTLNIHLNPFHAGINYRGKLIIFRLFSKFSSFKFSVPYLNSR